MSIRSMTGYGQANIVSEAGTITVEIRTVNHRHFDCVIRAPKDFVSMEGDARQHVKQAIARGRVDVFVSYEPGVTCNCLEIDWSRLKALRGAEGRLKELGFEVAAGTALDYLQFPGVLAETGVNGEQFRGPFLTCVDRAVKEALAMREREGARLAADLQQKLSELYALTQTLQTRAPEVAEMATERLRSRLKEVVERFDEARVITEAAILADKLAIDEEVTRLYSHIEEFSKSLKQDGAVGKRLDFISQEMNREVNTIGSKSQDLLVSKTVVELKTVIEQLREQVQNIE